MPGLADAVLPLIRTRSDLWRWRAANEHGAQMHRAIDVLEDAIAVTDPGEVYTVTNKALASAIAVIAKADDSSGIIGDACERLLDLHPVTASAAKVSAAKLVDWMIAFQFNGKVDYFMLDPVAYAPALGDAGVTLYRDRLDTMRAHLGVPTLHGRTAWPSFNHETSVLDWNERRLAVLDHDVEAIIRTHVRDGAVPRWYHDTAQAFEEIGDVDRAIEWAHIAAGRDGGHQAMSAADYWCTLVATHRPAEEVAARLETFRRWPNASTAARLHAALGKAWPDYRDEVMGALGRDARQAVIFAQTTLKDVPLAWDLAHSLGLTDARSWSDLAKAYQKVDPLAVLPIYRELVENSLEVADARNYRDAARRLATMRKLAAGTPAADEVDALIADLREAHRRRPRLQLEFDRAGLPPRRS